MSDLVTRVAVIVILGWLAWMCLIKPNLAGGTSGGGYCPHCGQELR